ncbi:MAG: hypothetical protein R3F28_08575 [Candidatus Kapaibacterium sp.]
MNCNSKVNTKNAKLRKRRGEGIQNSKVKMQNEGAFEEQPSLLNT